MEPLVNAKDLELFLVQPRATRRNFILRSGERIIGQLDFRSEFDSLADAISANEAWTFKRVGFFSPHVTVRRAGSKIEIATCHPNWTGTESKIQFSSGEVYLWKVASFWATSYSFSNGDGIELITFRSGSVEKNISNLFTNQALVHIAFEAWQLVELPLIVLLGWYLVLLQQDDSATVAVTGAIAQKHGIHFLVDAAQTAGAYIIDMAGMNIDLLAFSGHKGLYGPHGTGGLVVRPGVRLETWIEGGSGVESTPETMPETLPLRLEAGTQNAAGIAGLLAGVAFVQKLGVEQIRDREMTLTSLLIDALCDMTGLTILGPADLAHRTAVVSVTVEGYVPEQLAAVLDQVFDIATRAGLHCATQAHRTAGTLKSGAIRFSPGYFTTVDEIHEAAKALRSIQ